MGPVEFFKRLGGTVMFIYPPIPIRSEDYQAFHPAFCDQETGGEVSIGHGATEYSAACDALERIAEEIEEVTFVHF